MTPLTIFGALGTPSWHADSVAVVSYWYIPNGSDYDRAEVRKAYFADMEAAKRFAEKNSMPPEMASIEPWPPAVEKKPLELLKLELQEMSRDYQFFTNTDCPRSYEKEKADRDFCRQRIETLKAAIKARN